MKVRFAAVLLVLTVGSLLWLTKVRRTNPVPQFIQTTLSGKVPRTIAPSATSPPEGNPEVPEAGSDATPESESAGPVVSATKAAALPAREASDPEPPGVANLPPAIAMENMRTVFRQYCLRFGGNPVGNNLEITAALNGQNAKQVVFINPEDGMRVNSRGELIDTWDSPYFFHQLSRTEMEIRSAGSDRRMWTPDDLVIK